MPQEIWFGKYRVIKLLGRGGTAKVYLAEHIKLNSLRAIKHISRYNPLYKLQLREAQILKDLRHPCIPIIYDIEEDEDGSYIVEQYLEGVTLREYVEERNCLDSNAVVNFALQLCDLIKYLHSVKRPVLYLDLKPDNIIVSDGTLKLVDFGSAMFRDEAGLCAEHYGTIGYAAPELYGSDSPDERSDVYGIGTLLYFMATGRSLCTVDEKSGHVDFIICRKKLKRIISKCLRYDPSQRYASVSILERHLSAIMKRKELSAQRIIGGNQDSRSTARNRHNPYVFQALQLLKQAECEMPVCRAKRKPQPWRAAGRYFGPEDDDGIIKMNGIMMVAADRMQETDVPDFKAVVRDYGSWT